MRQLGRHSRRVTMVRASLPLLLLVARLDTGEPPHSLLLSRHLTLPGGAVNLQYQRMKNDIPEVPGEFM